ncbi:MAG TPA: DUF116 domain-containing protein [Thermodesulfovibrionales bacterium]|nr:DUF116 domain-containing protein [Thermodesulfovibrionales bacterium]
MIHRLMRGVTLKILHPVLMLVGAFSKKNKEGLQGFIIDLNNRLVRMEKPRAKRILLLLPHCLQINECDIRITHDIYKCKRCGKCEIKDLIQIADDNNLSLFVATGGNLARKIVMDVRPEAIVAVACERDLSSGIADSYPLPILGITNERPFGPCFNTQVSLERVKEAIAFFTG